MRNLQQMLSQMQKMQAELQQQVEKIRVEASSGGGMVSVAMSGSRRLLQVKIDPEVVKSGDIEMLQDLVQAAVNEAGRKVEEQLAEKMGGLTAGLNLPGLF